MCISYSCAHHYIALVLIYLRVISIVPIQKRVTEKKYENFIVNCCIISFLIKYTLYFNRIYQKNHSN